MLLVTVIEVGIGARFSTAGWASHGSNETCIKFRASAFLRPRVERSAQSEQDTDNNKYIDT